MKNDNLAIFTPHLNAYSETFIQQHRKLNKGNIVFYYGPLSSLSIENKGLLISKLKKGVLRVFGIVIGRPFFDIEFSISKSLKENNVTKILIEYGTYGAELLPFIKKTNIPFIVHFHGFDASSTFFLNKYGNIYKQMFVDAKYIISVSKQMDKKLLLLGCTREKLIYNVYGPDPQFKSINPTYTSKSFLAVGRLVEKKAPQHTVLAFLNVVKVHPDAILNIVGDGPLLASCQELIIKHNLTNNIFLTGKRNKTEIMEMLTNSCCFVQHSITANDGDSEGTPLTILEASSAGLPVVASRHAGIPDVILNDQTGLLFEENNIVEMSEKMIWILNNKSASIEMGKKGKERIQNFFTLERHLELLDKLLN